MVRPLTAFKPRIENIPDYINPFAPRAKEDVHTRIPHATPSPSSVLQTAMQDVLALHDGGNTKAVSFQIRDGYESPEACGDLYQSLTVGNAVSELPYNLPHVFAAQLRKKTEEHEYDVRKRGRTDGRQLFTFFTFFKF